MKKLLLFIGLLICFKADAQPDIKHSIYLSDHHCLLRGAENFNILNKVMQHSNGSIYGLRKRPQNVNGGMWDVQLYRYNAQYDTIWTKIIGGSESDEIEFIHELPNGDLLLTGTTSSNDGDVPYGHTYSAKEIWVLRIDTNGTILKGVTFGGSNGSDLRGTILSSDNYIYMAGGTIATDYDFTTPVGGWLDGNAWVAKMDMDLNLKWARVFIGNDLDEAGGVMELSNNKIVVSMGTGSTNIEMLGNQAKSVAGGDGIVFCIDSNKNTVWAKRYGCSTGSELYKCVVSPDKQRLCFVGISSKADLDIQYQTTPFEFNQWILITDTNGTILHSKAYGAIEGAMYLNDIAWHDNHLWILSRTQFGGGDVDYASPNPTRERTWLAMIDTNANLVAKYSMYFPTGNVSPQNLFKRGNDLYINLFALAPPAYPNNPFGCDTNRLVNTIYKIGLAPLSISNTVKERRDELFLLYPNPSSGTLTVDINDEKLNGGYIYRIVNIEGKLMKSGTWPRKKNKYDLNISEFPNGQYILIVENETIISQQQFIKI